MPSGCFRDSEKQSGLVSLSLTRKQPLALCSSRSSAVSRVIPVWYHTSLRSSTGNPTSYVWEDSWGWSTAVERVFFNCHTWGYCYTRSVCRWLLKLHTIVVVNGLKLIRHGFQRWLLSERQEEVLELKRIDSNLVSDCTKQPRLPPHTGQPHHTHIVYNCLWNDVIGIQFPREKLRVLYTPDEVGRTLSEGLGRCANATSCVQSCSHILQSNAASGRWSCRCDLVVSH